MWPITFPMWHITLKCETSRFPVKVTFFVKVTWYVIVSPGRRGLPSPTCSTISHTGAQLQINDATITYNYKSYIRNAAKTTIMFYAAPTHLAWSGDERFFSISEQHVTNCILVLTFKWFYSQLWKPGSRIPQWISRSTPLNIPTSSNNKRRLAGINYLMAV
jgi:hypothetical protein